MQSLCEEVQFSPRDRLTHMQLRDHFGTYAGGLEHALALATLAHASQRALGAQATVHPVRMALVLPDDDADARTVALLHEVIAGTDLTLDDLRHEGFPEHILAAVDALRTWNARQAFVDNERIARYENALEIFDMAS